VNRTGVFCFCALLSWVFVSPPLAAQYKTKIEQAEALLKKGKKKKALEILEFVFEKTKETDEIRQIGNLILSAAPLDYPKRENFLKYLVKFVPDHPDSRKWFTELGDRARRKKDLDEAEDWYLRAEAVEGDSLAVDQRFFSLYQEKKLYHRAFERGLKIIESHPELSTAAFRRDLARLWWKTGPLSEDLFDRLVNHPDGLLVVNELKLQSPRKADVKTSVYSQLRSHQKTEKIVTEDFAEKEKTPSTPNSIANNRLEVPGPFVDPKPAPTPTVQAPQLLPPPSAPTPAVETPAPTPPVAYEAEQILAPAAIPPPSKPPPSIRKLETKSDYLKYAQELADQKTINLKELNETVAQIYQKFTLDAEETALKNAMSTFEKLKNQNFPSKFNSDFLIQLRVCQDDVDKGLTVLQNSPASWKKITAPFVNSLMGSIAQKMLVGLDRSEIKSGPNLGDQKEQKLLLIREIEKKYSQFINK